DNDRREPFGLERIRRAARPAVVFALERPVLDGRDHFRPVFVESERERAVLQRPARRGHLLVAVEERPFHGSAVASHLEAERDRELVDDNARIPKAGERLRGRRRRHSQKSRNSKRRGEKRSHRHLLCRPRLEPDATYRTGANKKARKAVCLPGLQSARTWSSPRTLRRREPANSGATQAGGVS